METPEIKSLRRRITDKRTLFLIEKQHGLSLDQRVSSLKRQRCEIGSGRVWIDRDFYTHFALDDWRDKAAHKCAFDATRHRILERFANPSTDGVALASDFERAKAMRAAVTERGFAPNVAWPADMPLPDAAASVYVNIKRAADITCCIYNYHAWSMLLRKKTVAVQPQIPAVDWLHLLKQVKGFVALQGRFDFNIGHAGLVAHDPDEQAALDDEAAALEASLAPMQASVLRMSEAFAATLVQLRDIDEACALAAFGSCELAVTEEDVVRVTGCDVPDALAVYLAQCGFPVSGKRIELRPRDAFVLADAREPDDGMFSRTELLRLRRETFSHPMIHTPTLSKLPSSSAGSTHHDSLPTLAARSTS